MVYYTLSGIPYIPRVDPMRGIVLCKASRRKSTLNTGDTKTVNGVTYTLNENRRWTRADKKSRPRKSSPGANKGVPNVAIPILEDPPKVKGKPRRMTTAAPKANTEATAKQARRTAPRAMSVEGLPQLTPKSKPAQTKPKGKAKEKKPASGVADMRQNKDTGSRSNEKPAMQQTKAKATPKEIESKIREAYLKASGGEYVVRVRIAKLRQSLADVPREQFDEILNQMELAGKLTMMHLDDPQEIRPEDEQAAINIGGHMNHIVYMRDWADKDEPKAKADVTPKATPKVETKSQSSDELKKLQSQMAEMQKYIAKLEAENKQLQAGADASAKALPKITSPKEFESEAMKIYEELNRDYNLGDLVPIYRIRRAMGDRVSTRAQFTEWLLEMQANDLVQLMGGQVPNVTQDQREDSVTIPGGGLRFYVRKVTPRPRIW